jgi:hypothetical protein
MCGSFDILISFGMFISPVFLRLDYLVFAEAPARRLGFAWPLSNPIIQHGHDNWQQCLLMAIVTGDAVSERRPSFRYKVMVRGDAQT